MFKVCVENVVDKFNSSFDSKLVYFTACSRRRIKRPRKLKLPADLIFKERLNSATRIALLSLRQILLDKIYPILVYCIWRRK